VKQTNKVIDKKDAFLRAGNDWDSLSLMIDVYFDFSKQKLLLLEDAIKQQNVLEIKNIAHVLKGSLGMLGSIEACQSIVTLEESIKKDGLENIKTLYSNMNRDMKIFDKALKDLLVEKQL